MFASCLLKYTIVCWTQYLGQISHRGALQTFVWWGCDNLTLTWSRLACPILGCCSLFTCCSPISLFTAYNLFPVFIPSSIHILSENYPTSHLNRMVWYHQTHSLMTFAEIGCLSCFTSVSTRQMRLGYCLSSSSDTRATRSWLGLSSMQAPLWMWVYLIMGGEV